VALRATPLCLKASRNCGGSTTVGKDRLINGGEGLADADEFHQVRGGDEGAVSGRPVPVPVVVSHHGLGWG